MTTRHTERLAEAIREELDEIVNYELADPRIEGVNIAEVLLSPDARHARVLVSFSGGEDAGARALVALERAQHHLRRVLAQRLAVYRIPALRFEPELGPGPGSKGRRLLRRVRKGRPTQ